MSPQTEPPPDHRISSTSSRPWSFPLKDLSWFISPVCIMSQHIFAIACGPADPSALVIKSCGCSRICSILSSSMMIQQQMAAKMARINVRSMTNRASILHDFTVSQRADMLLLTETNTFNLVQAWWELSAGGSVRKKKVGPHSQQEPGEGCRVFF